MPARRGEMVALRGLPEKPGNGRAGLHDVAEIDVVEEQLRTASTSTRIAQESPSRARMNRRGRASAAWAESLTHERSRPLGLTMLALIVVVIMMGFPTAFTLMGLGIFFGYIAFYDPAHTSLATIGCSI